MSIAIRARLLAAGPYLSGGPGAHSETRRALGTRQVSLQLRTCSQQSLHGSEWCHGLISS